MYDVQVLNTTKFQVFSCRAKFVYPFSTLHVYMTVLLRRVQRRICLWRFAAWITRLYWSKMLNDHAVFMARYLAWRKFPAQAILPSLAPGSVRDVRRST